MIKKIFLILFVVLFLGVFAFSANDASASHAWGPYHWARKANPFTLKLGYNVTSAWDSYLQTASTDWSLSSVLDTAVVSGLTDPKRCRATLGRVEVCNSKYGRNGWLGLAQIWISGSHITQGVAKLNDTYFNTSTYNKPAWKNLVMCQEVAHTFGLDHQDENFSNPNLGTCMDYTSDPNGTLANPDQLSNEHPNQHDYDMLKEIYAHLDSTTTVSQTIASRNLGNEIGNLKLDWGRGIRQDRQGRDNLFLKDLGRGNKVLTHVFWVE